MAGLAVIEDASGVHAVVYEDGKAVAVHSDLLECCEAQLLDVLRSGVCQDVGRKIAAWPLAAIALRTEVGSGRAAVVAVREYDGLVLLFPDRMSRACKRAFGMPLPAFWPPLS